ncbi:MAG: acyl carrier protein [Jatrophihabitans sp.]
MTMDELRSILIECAGEAESETLSGDIADVEFEDLGYDSLALMETVARIKQRLGVNIPGEAITELRTPAAVLAAVNDAAPSN